MNTMFVPAALARMLRQGAKKIGARKYINWSQKDGSGADVRAQMWLIEDVLRPLIPGHVTAISEIRGAAACVSLKEANSFFENRGFTTRYAALEENHLIVAADVVFDLVWQYVGWSQEITISGRTIPGVVLRQGVRFFEAPFRHAYPIAEIPCDNGDSVFITQVDKLPVKGESRLPLWHTWDYFSETRVPIFGYSGVHFPVMEWLLEEEVRLMEGLWIQGQSRKYTISHAVQRVRLKLDYHGSQPDRSRAGGYPHSGNSVRPVMKVDGPVVIWCERPGWAAPVFVGFRNNK